MSLVGLLTGDVYVNGHFSAKTMALPDSTVDDSKVAAGSNIDADKIQTRVYSRWSQPNSAATAETRTLFVAERAGVVTAFLAGSIAAAIGDSTVTLDLKKNNVSILSAVVVLNNSNTARVSEDGAINLASDDFVAGDWFEVVITISAGTGTLPTGVFCQLELKQDAL